MTLAVRASRPLGAHLSGDGSIPIAPAWIAQVAGIEQWREWIAADLAATAGVHPTTAAYLTAVARLFADVAERTAPYRTIHRQAAAIDPEILEDGDAMQAERRRTMSTVADHVPRRGQRQNLADDEFRETLWALASPEMYDLLIGIGYSRAKFETWLAQTLTAALCA